MSTHQPSATSTGRPQKADLAGDGVRVAHPSEANFCFWDECREQGQPAPLR